MLQATPLSNRSIIIACDCDMAKFEEILEVTGNMAGVGGYKLGSLLAMSYGLASSVTVARRYTLKPIIYDHQKAGGDIPRIGRQQVEMAQDCGANAIIIFPLGGPKTFEAMIDECKKVKIQPIVGGMMTHEQFLAQDRGKVLGIFEEGYVRPCAPYDIYKKAIDMGIRDFVVPGNKPEYIKSLKRKLFHEGIKGGITLYAPGFVTQKGKISEAGKEAGDNWHAIVGKAITESNKIKATVETLVREL